jgi:hypothetical protein
MRERELFYKYFLGFLKIIPMLIAILYLINSILSYFNIDLIIWSLLGGLSVLPWLFIYMASFALRFCAYHRMFLYYVLVVDVINYIDYYYGIPFTDKYMFVLHIIVAGLFLFLVLYFHQKCRRKS